METKARIGRVNVDFEKLFKGGDKSQDVILRNGDIIYISDNKKQVYVYGQVNKPGYVPLKEGADFSYYIEKAGGLGQYADTPIMLIKARSRQWLEAGKPGVTITDGDYIWVPRTPTHSFNYYVGLAGRYLSIVASVATIYLLLKSL